MHKYYNPRGRSVIREVLQARELVVGHLGQKNIAPRIEVPEFSLHFHCDLPFLKSEMLSC
jgi:hypothetical protein